jgi:hypothetical protein
MREEQRGRRRSAQVDPEGTVSEAHSSHSWSILSRRKLYNPYAKLSSFTWLS